MKSKEMSLSWWQFEAIGGKYMTKRKRKQKSACALSPFQPRTEVVEAGQWYWEH